MEKAKAADAIEIEITASSRRGVLGAVVLVFPKHLLAEFASGFAPTEYDMLTISGLTAVVVISTASVVLP
ncbi:Tripartite tricarboxylate transporter TctA family protein [Labrenzia sp. THAF82]|uniref:tripartite tricarboxylate transporter permease n=1 Tax=Labrenzia sp. THAF82 TaxID=2587861 RepID=UPI0012681871|nr:tripartite tricarboxylate transporter permease [Labrenzia sp. THAF82]QFT34068.1 Tripartite tricarboxylate transporter TctA family protein [Labrenzia sp. THAF82]